MRGGTTFDENQPASVTISPLGSEETQPRLLQPDLLQGPPSSWSTDLVGHPRGQEWHLHHLCWKPGALDGRCFHAEVGCPGVGNTLVTWVISYTHSKPFAIVAGGSSVTKMTPLGANCHTCVPETGERRGRGCGPGNDGKLNTNHAPGHALPVHLQVMTISLQPFVYYWAMD